ncbi:MAG: hypothetical protein UT24_C0029G0003 [Candidatus Woesebacteria bacterium GW2011_GWB1_39_12]|uniref:Uncharacterized protein n=1 Tax=Candidatus Woesebacteria bacterium GW2011_GWB1_39_12 TaxID=1618574 RepID=A0A0G0QBA1_9BACT|nr:MAG: hypothetical protein UT24_C0029G0003 [Candidatus Woesebacteria bacterium GW2011_GWB1_39_12]
MDKPIIEAERVYKENKYEIIVKYKGYILRFFKQHNISFGVPENVICIKGGVYDSKSVSLKLRAKYAL